MYVESREKFNWFDFFAKEAIMDKVCVLLGMNDYEECFT